MRQKVIKEKTYEMDFEYNGFEDQFRDKPWENSATSWDSWLKRVLSTK